MMRLSHPRPSPQVVLQLLTFQTFFERLYELFKLHFFQSLKYIRCCEGFPLLLLRKVVGTFNQENIHKVLKNTSCI